MFRITKGIRKNVRQNILKFFRFSPNPNKQEQFDKFYLILKKQIDRFWHILTSFTQIGSFCSIPNILYWCHNRGDNNNDDHNKEYHTKDDHNIYNQNKDTHTKYTKIEAFILSKFI